MKYRRALVLADLHADPQTALSHLHRVAPLLERVVLVAKLRNFEPAGDDGAALDAWCKVASELASVDVRPTPQLSVPSLVELAITEDIELLVAGARTLEAATLLGGTARRLGIAWLWPSGQVVNRPHKHVVCTAIGRSSIAAILALLREHADPSLEISAIGPKDLPADELERALSVAGVRARVEIVPRPLLPLRGARGEPIDLVVLVRVPVPLLLAYPWPAPVLLVPAPAADAPRTPPFDVADAVELDGAIRVRIDDVTGLGSLAPAADTVFAFVAEGRVLAELATSACGDVELPRGFAGSSLGVVRALGDVPLAAFAAVEQHFSILRPSERELLLFDADLPAEKLGPVRQHAGSANLEPLAVRLRPTSRTGAIKERLREANLAAMIVDARAVLDEGEAYDIAEANDPVRLRRVAARLSRGGYAVRALFNRTQALAEPFGVLPNVAIGGNRVEVELDNSKARRWLLDAIGESRQSVCVQVYMAADDDVGRAVENALLAAARRGVKVRVLIDSLHGLHGSFGTENELISRLAKDTGIEARVTRPVTSFPSLADVKQRDHRKIAIADGRLALVGGRNLSHEYYTGFEEQHIEPRLVWRAVPWLDAGARIEGPAVQAIAAAFEEAWVCAGGEALPIDEPAALGSSATRVVVHRGLEDAHTLEAYLDLVDGARSHVYAVNAFPYALELQHALLRALRRGVSVRVLTGHLTPMHDGIPFSGPWAGPRVIATEFAHSRLDPIIEAGGDVYLFAMHRLPSWDPDIRVISPHVHAKLLSADGRRTAVGSANFDVTSSYWESELMIVAEDATVAQDVERTLDRLIAASTRVDRDDPSWRERARRRSWMQRWPGVLAI